MPDPALVDAAVETLLGDGQGRPRGTCEACPTDARGVRYPNLCPQRRNPAHAATVDYAMVRNVVASMWRQGHETALAAQVASGSDRAAVAPHVRMIQGRSKDALAALFADGRERTNRDVVAALGSSDEAVAQLLRRSRVVERVRQGVWRLRAEAGATAPAPQPGAPLAPRDDE